MINDRIQLIVDRLFNGNISAFCRATNIKQPTMNTILGERKSKPSYEVINSIINADALNISSRWLITGDGGMLNDIEIDILNKQGVPYYENIDVSGGILPMFNDNKEIPTFYINYQHFNDCTAYLPVVGDSMYPRYASGEIVAVKEIKNRDIIQWGEAYLVVCNDNADNLRTIKLVHPCEKDDSKIILRASNPNYKGDTPINKEDVISMFIVKGKITRNQL